MKFMMSRSLIGSLLICFLYPACNECSIDWDGDGFFTGGEFCQLESPPDCNDRDGSINPGHEEVLNSLDDDCDGRIDEETIVCADGSLGSPEITNHQDDDCDGFTDETGPPCDRDEDGFISDLPGCDGNDCNDRNRRIFPGALEDPFDEVDNDCNPNTDGTEIDCENFPVAPRIPKGVGIFHDCAGTGIEGFGRYDFSMQQNPISIPLAIHIFHDDNLLVGNGRRFPFSGTPRARKRSEELFYQAVRKINQDFSPMNFVFKIESINWAETEDDIAYADLAKGNEFETMRRSHYVNGKVNLYYIDRNNSDWGGTSSGPHAEVEHMIYNLSTGIFNSGTNLHSHELGHFFNLNHTHETLHGVAPADGSECYDTGDRICDTPPDLGPSRCDVEIIDNTCVVTECEGDDDQVYHPDPTNIMSYFPDTCGGNFTHEQMLVMTCSLWRHFPEHVAYSHSLQCGAPGCGNGIVEGIEECDDGNFDDSDQCDSLCRIRQCGNSIVDRGEECDDGNLFDNDLCTNSCLLNSICGDGIRQGDEECDDGNSIDDDICTNQCTLLACGDGIKIPSNGDFSFEEECDDGNQENGDGCNSECKLEQSAECGNQIVESLEQCDLGELNGSPNSPCSVDCKFQRIDLDHHNPYLTYFHTSADQPIVLNS